MKGSFTQTRAECNELLAGTRADLDTLRYESILVTGGTGFVGAWVTELLTAANDEFGLGLRLYLLSENADNFKERAPHLASRKDVFLIRRDVRLIDEIPNEAGWVIHAAGSPDTRLHVAEPLRIMRTIVDGTVATLTAASRLPNLKKFLNISSGLVYGPQLWEQDAIPESYLGKVDCASFAAVYPESKRMAETACVVFRSQFRLPVVNVRPFAFIGPYLPLDRPYAITNFIRDGLAGCPIRVVGDGETVRSYMYGSDMAAWLLTFLVRGVVGITYNLGSPFGLTLKCLANLIAQSLNESTHVQINTQSLDAKRSKWIPDVHRATDLGLRINVDLPTAINRTLRWYGA